VLHIFEVHVVIPCSRWRAGYSHCRYWCSTFLRSRPLSCTS